eukprot:m.886419 g.886419  ORF g.886419 m.886419 type:complete len:104 (+) comp23625_c0_seq8:1175-1486(+)
MEWLGLGISCPPLVYRRFLMVHVKSKYSWKKESIGNVNIRIKDLRLNDVNNPEQYFDFHDRAGRLFLEVLDYEPKKLDAAFSRRDSISSVSSSVSNMSARSTR